MKVLLSDGPRCGEVHEITGRKHVQFPPSCRPPGTPEPSRPWIAENYRRTDRVTADDMPVYEWMPNSWEVSNG